MIFFQGSVPTREAIHNYYQEQMLKSSRESGLDCSTHEAEGNKRREEKDAEGSSPDTDEEGPGGQTAEEEPETEPVPDGLEEPEPKAGSTEETVAVPSSADVEPEDDEYPECSVTKTSQRWRPKLSRMDRIKSSSSSSSSEEENNSQSHRWDRQPD